MANDTQEAPAKRGRKTAASRIAEKLGADKMYATLARRIKSDNLEDALGELEPILGFSLCSATFRAFIKAGVESGELTEGSQLYSIATRPVGNPKGRPSIKDYLVKAWGVTNIWPKLNEVCGQSEDFPAAIAALQASVGEEVTIAPNGLRNLLKIGRKSGRIVKDTPLRAISEFPRGAKPGEVRNPNGRPSFEKVLREHLGGKSAIKFVAEHAKNADSYEAARDAVTKAAGGEITVSVAGIRGLVKRGLKSGIVKKDTPLGILATPKRSGRKPFIAEAVAAAVAANSA